MLIDLTTLSPVTIHPGLYSGTLALRLTVGGEATGFTGVMQGRYEPFLACERNQPVPLHLNEDKDMGMDSTYCYPAVYLLDRPASVVKRNTAERWYYAATGWDAGVYIGHPCGYEVALECRHDAGDAESWLVTLNGDHARFTLMLPDYRPDFRLRAV